jgi:urease accessory protein
MSADVPHPAFEAYAAESIPQSAVGSPGKEGKLELVFAATEDGTRLVHDFARVPFHITGELDNDPHPEGVGVCVQSPSGGVVQGDRQTVAVEIRDDAVAHVGTASAARIQSMDRNYAANTTRLSVGAGGHLDFVPEPTILHADARYHSQCTLSLEENATAVVADVVVPGRLARDEWFDFDRYYSELECRGPDGLLFTDTTHHRPGDVPDGPGELGAHAAYGTLYALIPAADADRLHQLARDATDENTQAGATRLPNEAGVLIRAVGDQAESVTDALHAAWEGARQTAIGAQRPAGSGRAY